MTHFHQGSPHYQPVWVSQTPGKRDDNLPGPWPDINKNARVRSATPWLIER